jgi:hypothetical protein
MSDVAGAPRVVSLKIRGFRSFGTEPRLLAMDAPLIVIHAGNSQGKSSLAEAMEFLFTGHSSRRDLLGGAKAEYNDSLRNAHLPNSDDDTYVAAIIRAADGTVHEVRRELLCDFGAGTECQSRLLIDNAEAPDLEALGFPLADSPVRAPVLLQHTLRYVLSTEPKQRVGYFKALLALTDLDEFRTRVAAARNRVEQRPPARAISTIGKLVGTSAAKTVQTIMRLVDGAPDREAIAAATVHALLEAGVALTGAAVPDINELRDRLEAAVAIQREATFPLSAFTASLGELPAVVSPDIDGYASALADTDREAARLAPVVEAVLAIDVYRDLTAAASCPVCATPDALTPARLSALREQLRRTHAVDAAAATARTVLQRTRSDLYRLRERLAAAAPSVTTWPPERVETASARMGELGADPVLVATAMQSATTLVAAVEAARNLADDAITAIDRVDAAIGRRDDVDDLAGVLALFTDELQNVVRAGADHNIIAERFRAAVDAATTARISTTGLTELLAAVTQPDALVDELVAEAARRRTAKRLAAAERALREAAGHVLDTRFTQMGDAIGRWWLSLRPQELVGFAGVKRRAGGALFVNLVAALRSESTAEPVERDALGVFSDSQLNALGLSTFLARAELLDSAVVVLDDPIPGSDGDHRLTFVQNTLTALLDAGVQVVLTTFDGKLADWAQSSHDYRGLVSYQLTLTDCVAGTEPTQTSDMFSRLLLEAEDNLNAPTPRGRRAACGSYRSAAERLAKQIVATGRTNEGQPCSVADVDAEAKMLRALVPLVSCYARNNEERGKWKLFTKVLNPGNHDDDVPPTAELKQVRGNLRRIHKNHQDHWPGGLLV